MKMRETSRGQDKKPGDKNEPKFHPHGDSSVYDAMTRMTQDWQNHICLVQGQGNFGAVDGSRPAAFRYTEARLAAAAQWLVMDGIEEGAVQMVPNYDETTIEPVYMPSKLPMLLLNGVPSGSIGVGWASTVPPHNPSELARACLLVVGAMARGSQVSVEDIMEVMPGPDLPTGGVVGGPTDIAETYRTGRGGITNRATAQVDEGRNCIVITSLPYGETTEHVMFDIGEAAQGRKNEQTKSRGEPAVPEIRAPRDETERDKATQKIKIRIVIDVKQGENPNVVLEKLYKHTCLQQTISVNMIALDRGRQPRLYGLIQAIEEWAVFRSETVTRMAHGRLEIFRSRQHVIEGILLALEHIDEVVDLIKKSVDDDDTTSGLRTLLGVTTMQATSIAGMQLKRLNGARTKELQDEALACRRKADFQLNLITDPGAVAAEICEELNEAIRRFPEPRRTAVEHIGGPSDARLFIAPEDGLVTITGRGYLRKQAASEFRAIHRGGKGKQGAKVKADDVLRCVFSCHSHDVVFAFTHTGRVTKLDAHEIPSGQAGRHAANLGIEEGERVVAALATPWPIHETDEVILATNSGDVKRILLPSLVSKMTKTLNLYKGDGEVIGACLLEAGAGETFLASSGGLGTRFSPLDIRLSQRDSGGVRGIDLADGAVLVSLGRITGKGDELIMCVSSDGFGKRVNVDQFPLQNRGGRGRILVKLHGGATLVAAMILREEDTVLVATKKGMTARFRAGEIRELGRTAMGSRVMDLKDGDEVVSAAVLPPGETD
jgi:DNA gyrase subunit A